MPCHAFLILTLTSAFISSLLFFELAIAWISTASLDNKFLSFSVSDIFFFTTSSLSTSFSKSASSLSTSSLCPSIWSIKVSIAWAYSDVFLSFCATLFLAVIYSETSSDISLAPFVKIGIPSIFSILVLIKTPSLELSSSKASYSCNNSPSNKKNLEISVGTIRASSCSLSETERIFPFFFKKQSSIKSWLVLGLRTPSLGCTSLVRIYLSEPLLIFKTIEKP